MGLLDDVLSNENQTYSGQPDQGEKSSDSDTLGSIDNLIHQKTRILRVKLEVLAAEILDRFFLRDKNLNRIEEDQYRTREIHEKISRQVNYQLRAHREKQPFYELLFGLEKEKREQEVECWRDVAQVMTDFLNVWEAHEQAKARSEFLNDAGD